MKDYKQLIENIQSRINPDNIILKKSFSDEISSISYSNILTYIRYAMKGVEIEYTQKSKLAGERVKNHLKEQLSNVTYQYQGSVMTDTHIKGASDIDLLVLCDKFYMFDRTSISSALKTQSLNFIVAEKLKKEIDCSGYFGNTLEDLKKIRTDSENILIPIYDICDITHSKAVKIKNKHLNRDVDIVIANWFDNINAILKDRDFNYRGVQVYNKFLNLKGFPSYPFLSIKRINERSSETNGRLKRMIRFLKNIKVDSEQQIELTSFEFNAICYSIETYKYSTKNFYQLVPVIYQQLKALSIDSELSSNLKSVDGNEYVFRNKPEKIIHLKKIMLEIDSILSDLRKTKII